jgi:hypothetical protein
MKLNKKLPGRLDGLDGINTLVAVTKVKMRDRGIKRV